MTAAAPFLIFIISVVVVGNLFLFFPCGALPPHFPLLKFSVSLNGIFVQIFFVQLVLFIHNFHCHFKKAHHHSRAFVCFGAAPASLHDFLAYCLQLSLFLGAQLQQVNYLILLDGCLFLLPLLPVAVSQIISGGQIPPPPLLFPLLPSPTVMQHCYYFLL
jgi:hypothetical protein